MDCSRYFRDLPILFWVLPYVAGLAFVLAIVEYGLSFSNPKAYSVAENCTCGSLNISFDTGCAVPLYVTTWGKTTILQFPELAESEHVSTGTFNELMNNLSSTELTPINYADTFLHVWIDIGKNYKTECACAFARALQNKLCQRIAVEGFVADIDNFDESKILRPWGFNTGVPVNPNYCLKIRSLAHLKEEKKVANRFIGRPPYTQDTSDVQNNDKMSAFPQDGLQTCENYIIELFPTSVLVQNVPGEDIIEYDKFLASITSSQSILDVLLNEWESFETNKSTHIK